MEKSLFEQMGGTYEQQGDYVVKNFILSTENLSIGIWGQRHGRYLKQRHKILYYNLLKSAKLNTHPAEIDRQARMCFGTGKADGRVLKRDGAT